MLKENKLKQVFFNARLDYRKRDLYYYLPKLVVPILIALFVFGIITTNINLLKDEIISDINYGVDSSSRVSLFGISSEEYQSLLEQERLMVKYVFDNINDDELYSFDYYFDKVGYVSSIISKQYNFNDIELFIQAEKVLNKYQAINNIGYGLNHIFFIFLSFILGYFFIDFIFFLLKHWNVTRIEEENERLEILTVLIGENEGATTEDILNTLANNSNVFKPYLERAYDHYHYDNINALLMLNKVPYVQFKTIAKTLLQYRNSDKGKAISNLKRDLERKKKRQMNKEEFLINAKTYIALGLMLPPFLCLLMLWFYPLLIIFSNLTF